MREILFRGKRIDNDEWVEGYYVRLYGSNGRVSRRIYTSCAEVDCGDYYPDFFEVQPATVGQYTGLKDKNGKRIFEGDIVRVADDEDDTQFSDGGIGRVAFDYGLWYVHGAVSNSLYDVSNVYHTEVIGNIHDNPELMEVR